jgi:MYXO-CTERM domain-containing protein
VFRPQRAGRHVARIQLAIDGAPGEVELSGDALGDLPAPTSFYACNCRGAPAPSPAAVAPIALAALLALRRPRRRRVSGPPVSGRCRSGSS